MTMANLCITHIVIEGELATLTRINDAVKEHPGWIGTILNTLGIECSEKDPTSAGFINEKGEIAPSADGKKHCLKLHSEDKWTMSCFMSRLSQKFDVNIYFSAECPDDGWWVSNDKKGLYFPERYLIDWGLYSSKKDEDENMAYFNGRQEMLDFIKEKFGCEKPRESVQKEIAAYSACKIIKGFTY